MPAFQTGRGRVKLGRSVAAFHFMKDLVDISTKAPSPRMQRDAAARFEKLREAVRTGSGVDFLARCSDVFRDAGFVSAKEGVGGRSWHRAGRAFDYDRANRALILVSEPIIGRQYFRTYLRCSKQDGTLGTRKQLIDIRGGSSKGFVFDFTAAAKEHGFLRIPAWPGWQTNPDLREFWHYECRDGLTWNEAMLQLSGKTPEGRVIGLNDADMNTGGAVSLIQIDLHARGLLRREDVDGTYGRRTRNAVAAFQRLKNITDDGLVGDETRKHLGL